MKHLQLICSIGPERFAAVCSDNTGNTKKARKNITERFPAIMNLADVCHHLANTAKDISKLPEFQKVRNNLHFPFDSRHPVFYCILGPLHHEESHHLLFTLHIQRQQVNGDAT